MSKIQTDIFNYKSKEFFINLNREKDIPDPKDKSYGDFVSYEKDKCRRGLNINGVFIPGRLYYHLNYHKISLDSVDEYGKDVRSISTPSFRDNEWILFNAYENCVKEKEAFVLGGARQISKDLQDDSLLYTETDVKKIKDAQIGDRIYDDSGELTTIVKVLPQGLKDIYRITLLDGRTIECSDTHDWYLYNISKGKYETKNIKEIEDVKLYSIDYCKPVQYKEKEVKINPFLLGVWLADVTAKKFRIYSEGDYLNKLLEEYNLIDNKHIPYDYLYNSVEKRKDLLFGLIESSNNFTFNTKIPQLREDFIFLARSLGYGCKVKDNGSVRIYTHKRCSIVSIEKIGESTTTCISVDNKSKLFLTNDFTITHNSESLCSLTLYEINLYLNSECLLLFTNAPDKQTFTKKAQVALQNGEKFMMRPLIDNNWKNTEIRFGITNKDNTTNVIGRLFMYNTDGGNSTEIGAGKALLHGSKLYYADREGVIEDAKVGDKIFGVDGNLTTITGVYPQGEVDIYEITFSDGRIAKCCKDHLWVVKEDRNKSFKVLSTKEMLDSEINYYLPEVQFTSELTLFALKHKIQIRLYEPQIVKIKYFGKGKATCISVDNESKLFLTDDFIPTHNTLSFFAYDEIAKDQFRESYDAVIPAIRGANGFRNPPFLAFCVCAGTKVWDKEGKLVNIEDINKETGIVGYDGYKALPQKVSWIAPPHKKECVRLHLEGKNILECSIDHPILMSHRMDRFMEKGVIKTRVTFKKANELVIGDRIAMVKEVPIFGTVKKPHARFLGLMIGDGNYSLNKTPQIGGADYELHDFLIANYDVRENESMRFITKEGKVYKSYSIRNCIDIFKEAGIHKQVKFQKRLPVNIHEYDKESLAELLGGYFDADSNVSKIGKKNIRIVLTSICKELLEEVKFNLLKFGINSNVTYESRNGKQSLGKLDYIYRLYINDLDSVKNFQKNIKYLIKDKQERLDQVLTKNNKVNKGRSICSFVPGEKGKYFEGKHDMTNIRFQCLEKVEYIGLKDVYNLTVNDTHTYIANGIITSNTGGNVEKARDAEGLFFNPKSGYAKAFINEGKETGFFMGGTYRQDFKNECKFGEYLAKQNIKIPPKSELYNLKFKYSDVERANKTLDLEQENASKDKDPKTLLKHKMYNPRTIKEMFLKNDTKYFPTEKLKQHKEYLDANPIGEAIELVQNVHTKEIVVKPSKRLVIKEYPIKNKYIDLDAPMVIYDKPKYRNFGLHVIGVDCIREDETSSSDSLASFYIGRRNHTDLTDNFRGKIVASYAGRPKTVKEFHKLIELAAEYYNATILYEHTDRAFLDYFETRNKAHLLIDTIPMQREINHNSKTQNSKGLKPTVGNKLFLLNQALNYTNDELEDDNLGLTRIPDPMLAEELIEYDGDKNTDRYIAFSHMVAAMGYYDKFGVVNTTFDQENMEEEIANFKKSKTMFNFSNNNKRSAFGFI